MAALIAPAVAVAGYPFAKRASAICDRQLRAFDGTDVFALSPNEVLRLARRLDTTELRLRKELPSRTLGLTRRLRLQLVKSGHLGRIYSRAYRRDPSDNSLRQEAAFENALLDLRRVARRSRLPACSVKLAAP